MKITDIDEQKIYSVKGRTDDGHLAVMQLSLLIDPKRTLTHASWSAFVQDPDVGPMFEPRPLQFSDGEIKSTDPQKLAVKAGHELEADIEQRRAYIEAQRSEQQPDPAEKSPLVIIGGDYDDDDDDDDVVEVHSP